MTLLPSLDPGSSGYVSSSRCLGTRTSLHQRAMREECKMRNWFSMDGSSEEREFFLVEPAAGSGLPDPSMNAFGETKFFGGAGRDRTDDLKLAKLPLSQLSYGPTLCLWPAGQTRKSSRRAVALAALRAVRKR